MPTQLNLADLPYLLAQNVAGDVGVDPGADPFSLAGLRTIDGTHNNLKASECEVGLKVFVPEVLHGIL